MRNRLHLAALVIGVVALAACTNDPYPNEDAGKKIFYDSFVEAPKNLDPAVAYTTSAHAITGNVYDTLLEYHYLKRPYTLIPGLATEVPEPEHRPDGRVAYRFTLRPDLIYQDDPAFGLGGKGRRTRQIVAADVAFELMRIADPAVNSPIIEHFSNLVGLSGFSKRLAERRKSEAGFAELPVHVQYERVGPIEGVRVLGPLELEILLAQPYPQILYWFAMPFTSPVPWEAVAYYDGDEEREFFADHPVGSGPFRLVEYDKQFRMVLEVNPNWYGIRHPEWRAPGATYPDQGEPGDRAAGLLDPRVVGKPLPFLESVEYSREKESIPRFNKFLQGYYDASAVIKESFDTVIQNDRLSKPMVARGIHLVKSVAPAIYYIGFNMEDRVVGEPAGERGRKLRQAMSTAVNSEEWTRLFLNSRGVPAQSPLPPEIFGHEASYRNPFRTGDLDKARRLLAQAGYPGGIDPRTGKPLRLTFDSYQTSAEGLLQIQYFVDTWREIGLDVRIEATSYNQFQEKVRNGAYQIFSWGWVADYPDPENFLFLLTSRMSRSRSGGPNTANFSDARYDRLFEEMKARENDAQRLAIIRKMIAILEQERPWIELFYPEDYALYHGWLHNVKPAGLAFPTAKYRDVDPILREREQRAWNRPVIWPAYALLGAAIAIVLPGVRTFLRERQ